MTGFAPSSPTTAAPHASVRTPSCFCFFGSAGSGSCSQHHSVHSEPSRSVAGAPSAVSKTTAERTSLRVAAVRSTHALLAPWFRSNGPIVWDGTPPRSAARRLDPCITASGRVAVGAALDARGGSRSRSKSRRATSEDSPTSEEDGVEEELAPADIVASDAPAGASSRGELAPSPHASRCACV